MFEYKTELFNEDTIAQTIADYLRIAGGGRREPGHGDIVADRPGAKPDAECAWRRSAGRHPRISRPVLRPSYGSSRNGKTSWASVPSASTMISSSLGASSLAVARLSERLRAIFPVELPLAAIFQARTVGRIAALVRDGGPACSSSALAPIQPTALIRRYFSARGLASITR